MCEEGIQVDERLGIKDLMPKLSAWYRQAYKVGIWFLSALSNVYFARNLTFVTGGCSCGGLCFWAFGFAEMQGSG